MVIKNGVYVLHMPCEKFHGALGFLIFDGTLGTKVKVQYFVPNIFKKKQDLWKFNNIPT